MVKYFDEEWPKEEAILNLGLKMSRQSKAERQAKTMDRLFCIGNGESRLKFDLKQLKKFGKLYGCNAIYRDHLDLIDVLTCVDNGISHEVYHNGVCQKIPCYFRHWTKLPEFHYTHILKAQLDKLESEGVDIEQIKKVMTENAKGDSKEFVMHGSSIEGLATIIKQNKDRERRNVSLNNIYISWIKEPDHSHTLEDVMHDMRKSHWSEGKDYGWAAGPTSGFIGVEREKPKKVYLIGHDLLSHTITVNNVYKSTNNYVAAKNNPTPAINWVRQWRDLFQWFPDIQFIKVSEALDNRNKACQPYILEWKGMKNVSYMTLNELQSSIAKGADF